jgi:ribosomal protein S18 acetylase RimI-like enzyme
MTVSVEVAREATDELVDALGHLVPQLSASPAPGREWIGSLIGAPGVSLLVARAGGRIVGTLTLVTFPTPTRLRAIIEDVVVDSAARGKGAGRALLAEAERLARAAGAPWIDLTSRPARAAANRLYRAYGFELRETNAYRLALGGP